jgi:hypothetical protein
LGVAAERRVLEATALVAGLAAAALVAGLDPLALRLAAGLLLVLVLPGYALSQALLRAPALGAAERTVLTLALSLGVTILSALLLNLSPWSLSHRNWPPLLAGVTIAACVAAWVMNGDVVSGQLRWRWPPFRNVITLALAGAIAAAAIAVASAPRRAPEGVSGYSELWLVPRERHLELGLASGELSPVRYRLDLTADGRLVRRWRALFLRTGDRWQVNLPRTTFERSPAVIEARLYRSDRPRSVYRRVRVRVRPGSRSGLGRPPKANAHEA